MSLSDSKDYKRIISLKEYENRSIWLTKELLYGSTSKRWLDLLFWGQTRPRLFAERQSIRVD
jgi:hypothetical protein